MKTIFNKKYNKKNNNQLHESFIHMFKSILLIGMSISTFLFTVNAQAETSLSKEVVTRHVAVSEQLKTVTKSIPNLDQNLSQAMIQGKPQVVKYLSSLPVYPKVESTIKSGGFDSVDQFLDVGMSIVGATISQQMASASNGLSIDMYIADLQSKLTAADKQGLAPEMLAGIKGQLSQQLESLQAMKKMSSYASEADIKFVNDNAAWVKQQMSRMSQ